MNSTKCASELQKKKSRDEQGAWKDRVPDRSSADPRHCCCATLIIRKPTMIQALRFAHAGPGESELSNKWYDECQLACRDKHICIHKSESKSMYWKLCHEHRHI